MARPRQCAAAGESARAMTVALDTNHFTELVRQSTPGDRLLARLRRERSEAFTTIVNAQEITEGLCALINRLPAGEAQINAYRQFSHSLRLLMELGLLEFDTEAATAFHQLQTHRLRVGTMDLKIAAVCLAHDALLLTRNLRDFEQIPRLKVENWLD